MSATRKNKVYMQLNATDGDVVEIFMDMGMYNWLLGTVEPLIYEAMEVPEGIKRDTDFLKWLKDKGKVRIHIVPQIDN